MEKNIKWDVHKFLQTNSLEDIKHEELHKLSIAPMVDVTDTYFRTFIRFITKKSMLYTEMIHYNTILSIKGEKKLKLNPVEKPIALQIGGSDPEKLAEAAKIGEKLGYDEINLNCGCPSSKVQMGAFGACLMKNPEKVGICLKKMKESVKIPVTCKCRLGVDEFDSYEFFEHFVDTVYKISKVDLFIVHARKAYLKGLNPKENRTVPPLLYNFIYKIAKRRPYIKFVLNGGIKTKKDILKIPEEDQNLLKGYMIGRTAYQNIWEINGFDNLLFGSDKNKINSREEILYKWGVYGDYVLSLDKNLNRNTLIKPIISLFNGQPGSRLFKSYFSDAKNVKGFKSLGELVENFFVVFKKSEYYRINPKVLKCLKF